MREILTNIWNAPMIDLLLVLLGSLISIIILMAVIFWLENKKW